LYTLLLTLLQAIEKHCRTDTAYGSSKDVSNAEQEPEDKMESFFLAETLK
jgi:Glycosyl hydrolase family 47